MNYKEFLRQKTATHQSVGIEPPEDLGDHLFPFQRDLVRWALRKGRCAIFASTGLGKTRQELTWARNVYRSTGRDILILAPLAVTQQTHKEGIDIGIASRVCRDGSDVEPGITITNYDRLHRFDCSRFVGVVLDECFAPGTMVDTDKGARAIESIRIGDRIQNASGVDTVSEIHRREVSYAIKIYVKGEEIIVSPNHPIFTQNGWVPAQDLQPGDAMVETSATMRLVRDGIRSEISSDTEAGTAEILRQILLSEMENEHTRTQGESSHKTKIQKDIRCSENQTSKPNTEDAEEHRAHSGSESNAERGITEEVLHPIAGDRPQTFRAWGQRERFDAPTKDLVGCTRIGLDCGIQFIVGPTNSGISNLLQDRLGEHRESNRYRGGWYVALQSEGDGQKERREAAFARVDRLEVLEQGHPDLERFRSTNGRIYFFDVKASQHPSFSVNGLLVHNSSCIKHVDSKTFSTLCEVFAQTPYKLAATATPAPNDFVELGTHAEFLGVRSQVEMLAEFFVHDGGETQKWRLKGHARSIFWKWVSSWGALVRMPSDLGYEDDLYNLPPLKIHQHTLSTNIEEAHARGFLFPVEAQTLIERRGARKASVDSRVQACAEIVNADSGEPWIVWCDLNTEGDALRRSIDGAIEVRGSDSTEDKEARLVAFSQGKIRVLVSKPSICGWGLNWQHVARVAFVGVTDSFEAYYQAIRRCWRFGQKREVEVHIFASIAEGSVIKNLERKERDANEMARMLSAETRSNVIAEVRGTIKETNAYDPKKRIVVPNWLKGE